MPSLAKNPEQNPELVPLNPIRVETALSRYPIHRLARKGSISIELHEASETGATTVRWEVDHGKKYGQPGPLAYKVDTLVINRRIEEAARPIPRIIKLGSLHDLCHELGISEGRNRDNIKKSLYQNASAFITAKLRYRLADGSEQTLEAGFSRYAVVFTGERLPDGRTADAVYLVLSDIYMQVINCAQTRPLDYDYLKELPPASQRFYELVSYQIYAALKHNRPRARLSYAEFCTYAPLTRHFDWLHVRTQMNKVHGPHRKSGYIADIEFEATTDKEERPDWLMFYVPGPRAKAEYRAFTKKGGAKVLEIETTPATPEPKPESKPAPSPEPTQLELELINRGVTATTARELVEQYREERINAQVERADWIREKHPKKISDLGAYLVEAIRNDYAAPAGFVSRAERERRRTAEEAKKRAEAEARRQKQEAEARERETEAKVDAYLKTLDAAALAKLDAEVLERADAETRETYERQYPKFRDLYLRHIREAHVRALLNLPPKSDA
jgi:hypothetical protein